MSKKGNIFLYSSFLFLLLSCDNSNDYSESNKIKRKTLEVLSINDQQKIFNYILDSIECWKLNNLGRYKENNEYSLSVDSLLCFNSVGDKFITCLHTYIKKQGPTSDGLIYFYGELQGGNWYFFSGNALIIPRSNSNLKNINSPLSYKQLHEVALKQIYSGYLTKDKINEAWFTSHFENVGWGDFTKQGEDQDWYLKGQRFKNKKDFYRAMHLIAVGNNWSSRDTTKPIKQLPNTTTALP